IDHLSSFLSQISREQRYTLFPYTTLFRSLGWVLRTPRAPVGRLAAPVGRSRPQVVRKPPLPPPGRWMVRSLDEGRLKSPTLPSGDRKSTRLNSSHLVISYAVFCLKKKINT